MKVGIHNVGDIAPGITIYIVNSNQYIWDRAAGKLITHRIGLRPFTMSEVKRFSRRLR